MKNRCVVVGMVVWAGCGASVVTPESPAVASSDPFASAARAIDRLQADVDAVGGAETSTPLLDRQGDSVAVVAAVAMTPGVKTRAGYQARVEGNVDAVWEWARADVRNAFLAMTAPSAIDAHALAQLQSCVVDSMQRAHPDGPPVAPTADDDETYPAAAFAPWLFRRSASATPAVVATSESGLTIPVSAAELHPRVLVRDGQCFVVEPRLRLRTSTRWTPTREPVASLPSEQELYAATDDVESSLFEAEKRTAELRRALGNRRGPDRRIGELRHVVERDEAVIARLRQRAEQLEHALGTNELMWLPVDLLVRAADPAPPATTVVADVPLRATSVCRVHAPSVDMQLRLHIPSVSRDARVNVVQLADASQPNEVVACTHAQVFGDDELVCFVPERTVIGPRTRFQVLRATEHDAPDARNESQLGERWSDDAGVACTGLDPAR